MLERADQAIVVVGEERTRSKTMDRDLRAAIDEDGLRARQALLPSNTSPRVDTIMLPHIQLTSQEFIDSVLQRRSRNTGVEVLHATNSASAKLLMTPMRDASVSGPALREVHRRVGQYLAIQFLPGVVGMEEYTMLHVQGHRISGHRLLNEKQTLIVALMRGGEPMAFGINDIYPLAMFLHAKSPENIRRHHLQEHLTVVLVDSVVNNGTTIVQFEEHIRKLNPTIKIVVVAGVVQEKAVSDDSLICGSTRNTQLDIIALRLSANKFTGKGTTDTGNRLFNTTSVA